MVGDYLAGPWLHPLEALVVQTVESGVVRVEVSEARVLLRPVSRAGACPRANHR